MERAQALDNLADALRELVPLVAAQNSKLDTLAPRAEVEDKIKLSQNELTHQSRRRLIIGIGAVLFVVLAIFTPLAFIVWQNRKTLNIAKGVTSPAAAQTQIDTLNLLVVQFDCKNEENIQGYENSRATAERRSAIVVFPNSNCPEALKAALQKLEADRALTGASSPPTTSVTTNPKQGPAGQTGPRGPAGPPATPSTTASTTTTTTSPPPTTPPTTTPPNPPTPSTTCVTVDGLVRACS